MEVKPYVYRLTHKYSGQFYIGYREANKLPAILDLPIYKSSSEIVKSLGFDNFNWEIISELSDGKEAYDLENEIISTNIRNPLCLNKQFVSKGKLRFRRIGPQNPETIKKIKSFIRSEELNIRMRDIFKSDKYRENMSRIKTGQIFTAERKKNISNSLTGRKLSDEHINKISKIHAGKIITESHKEMISKGNSKNYTIISPDGEIYDINNLSKFCKDKQLSAGHLSSVCSGKKRHYKGWTGKIKLKEIQ